MKGLNLIIDAPLFPLEEVFKYFVSVMADCPHTIGVEFGTRIIEVNLISDWLI